MHHFIPSNTEANEGEMSDREANDLISLGYIREIGSQAVWSLSSCKPGFGIENLRDGRLETYWQSDGPQPHLINIQFLRKTEVCKVLVFADFKQDESYTPQKLSVRCGNNFNDLQEIELVKMKEPTGWITVNMTSKESGRPIKTFMVQIAILSNHQNGRDTHVRQIKIFSPKKETILEHFPNFATLNYSMVSTIR